MKDEEISAKLSYPSKYVDVLGSKIHFVETGHGDPILFLHGIPMSCYVWRNVIPHLAVLGRCIAPDLIGFGRSAKPDIHYTVDDHIRYIEHFIDALALNHITLVMHGWGSVMGFDYAMRHENRCKGLVFYEAFLRSLHPKEASLPFQEQLKMLQDQGDWEAITMHGASFIDKIIPPTVMRSLTEEEMNHYRQPFLKEGTGKPITQYLKEFLKGNENNKVDKLIANYSKKLTHSELPKLMLYSLPGFITTMDTAIWAKAHLPHLEIVDVGEDLHLAQETRPSVIGETISAWLQGVEQMHV